MANFIRYGKMYTFGDLCALYAHPQSGDVQPMVDWLEDSDHWEGDILAQLSTLIRVDNDE